MTEVSTTPRRNTIASDDNGRGRNLCRGWILMDRKRFDWTAKVWWERGFEAGVKAAREKAGQA